MSECIICREQFNATTTFSNQVCSDRCNQLADPKFNLKHYIEKLESENAKLKQENDELKYFANKYGSAKIRVCMPSKDGPFNKEDCRVIEFGFSDNVYIVECEEVTELKRENERLRIALSYYADADEMDTKHEREKGRIKMKGLRKMNKGEANDNRT